MQGIWYLFAALPYRWTVQANSLNCCSTLQFTHQHLLTRKVLNGGVSGCSADVHCQHTYAAMWARRIRDKRQGCNICTYGLHKVDYDSTRVMITCSENAKETSASVDTHRLAKQQLEHTLLSYFRGVPDRRSAMVSMAREGSGSNSSTLELKRRRLPGFRCLGLAFIITYKLRLCRRHPWFVSRWSH